MFIGSFFMAKTPLTVSVSNVLGSDTGVPLSGLVTSENEPSPVVEHGTGDYSYSWAHISGDSPNISNAAAENPVWSETVTDGDPSVSTWRLTVTDNETGETAYDDCQVQLIWSSTA